MDDLNLDLEDGQINKTEERIKTLSSKVKETAQERDAAKAAVEAAETAKKSLEKERDFFASFSDMASKYPTATEFRDKIKEKVMAGYSVDDATVAVLNKEGKLTPPPVAPAPPPPSAAGGSAAINLPDGGVKPLNEMTRQELREALANPERAGELEDILRRGLR